jgi:hypothetical protein
MSHYIDLLKRNRNADHNLSISDRRRRNRGFVTSWAAAFLQGSLEGAPVGGNVPEL